MSRDKVSAARVATMKSCFRARMTEKER